MGKEQKKDYKVEQNAPRMVLVKIERDGRGDCVEFKVNGAGTIRLAPIIS